MKRGLQKRSLHRFELLFALALTASSFSCVHRVGGDVTTLPAPAESIRTTSVGSPRIRLFWRTETESNAFGFFVYRAEEPNGKVVCINADHPLQAAGNSVAPQEYVFYDLNVRGERNYYYRLQQVDLDGTQSWIAGHPDLVVGRSKPLTDGEFSEIARQGSSFRRSPLATPEAR